MELLARHGTSMAVYLSTGMLEELADKLIEGGYKSDTPAAIVYKATWPEEKKIVCTIGELAEKAQKEHIEKTAIVLIGDVISHSHYDRSRLYDPSFSTEFRKAAKT
jgi:precorrin-4/cobalt-precorrin-4 C11-methyltransferase